MTLKLTKVKQRVAKHSIIAAVIVGVFAVGYAYLWFIRDNLDSTLAKTKSDITRLQKNVDDERKAMQRFILSYEDYEVLKNVKLGPAKRLSETTTRLAAARAILEGLKTEYRLSSLDFSITTPDLMRDDLGIKRMRVLNSRGTLTIAGASDATILEFLDSMVDRMPGYITITSLQMNRVRDLDRDVYDAIRTGGQVPEVVRADILFDWRSFEDVSPPSQPPAQGGQ